jgi:hypothetical protein
MVKRIFWKQMVVREADLSARLTSLNFQPGKFVLTYLPLGKILIVYVDKEIKNVE